MNKSITYIPGKKSLAFYIDRGFKQGFNRVSNINTLNALPSFFILSEQTMFPITNYITTDDGLVVRCKIFWPKQTDDLWLDFSLYDFTNLPEYVVA